MNTPPPRSKPALQEELDNHMQALMKLRAQMLQLHAKLEYLRLMARLRARADGPVAGP